MKNLKIFSLKKLEDKENKFKTNNKIIKESYWSSQLKKVKPTNK